MQLDFSQIISFDAFPTDVTKILTKYNLIKCMGFDVTKYLKVQFKEMQGSFFLLVAVFLFVLILLFEGTVYYNRGVFSCYQCS